MKNFRVYIGWDSREDIAYQVARRSLLRHASIPVEVVPIKVQDLGRQVFGVDYVNPAPNPAQYDMQSEHAGDWGESGSYLYSLDAVLAAMREFVQGHPDRKPLSLPSWP